MKRHTYIRKMSLVLSDEDIAIFAGEGMSREAYKYDRPGNLYLSEYDGIASSLALGVALGTDKRVFIFCEDSEFIKEFGSILQIAVSKCQNIFFVVMNSGCYQDEGGTPAIFNGVLATKGVWFNMGFMIQDYTKHISNGLSKEEMRIIVEGASGPCAVFLSVEPGVIKSEEVGISTDEMMERFKDFVSNKEREVLVVES